MTFLEALKTGRPMRRKRTGSWQDAWITLGFEGHSEASGTPRWREVASGKAIGLQRYDYTADDWEAMP